MKNLDNILKVYEAVQALESLDMMPSEKKAFCENHDIKEINLNWFITVESIERAKLRGDNPFFKSLTLQDE